MNCPSCGAENSADHRHCWNCGSKLEAPCPGCGKANPAEHRFCSDCGEPLDPQEKCARREERRFITALFMDLVGFTPLSEASDPEEIRRLLTTYFDHSKAVIERFGGVVDKYTGDAVTAFWGAITATENDAEVAVRAGLELIDSVAALGGELGMPDLAARVGILSGEAAVGPGGNEKGLVVGDIVNTAARLQAVAEAGTVVVGESTQRLASRAISFELLGNRELKGKTVPVPVWRAVRITAELGGRRRQEALDGPFVGRQEELRLLKDQLSAVGRERRARLISVMGEAGIGKSRLLWEFEKYLDGLAQDTYWHIGRSPSYGEGITFWALGEMIRRRAGIAENDDSVTSRSRLKATLSEFLIDADERSWIEPRLMALLGLDPMPAGEREELFAALRIFFQRIAEHGTTVLVFEDLHWADSGLLDFIIDLTDRSSAHPLLVITMARPELIERQASWGAKRNQLSVHLGPLADSEVRELVTGLTPGIPEEAAGLIAERSGGIPLYAVEMVRMLLGTGVLVPTGDGYALTSQLAEAPLPDSVQAVIGARLDRLPTKARAMLQEASVIGTSFLPKVLSELTGNSQMESELDLLVDAQLLTLEDDPRAPERGQYRFVQGLIREVAYGRLTKAERRSRHLAAAELYERSDDPELAPLVASHYMSAYRAGPKEDTQLALQARMALLEAARRAAELHSDAQAYSLCMQALGMATGPADRPPILIEAAEAANSLGHFDEAVALMREALDWYESQDDRGAALHTAAKLANTLCDADRTHEALGLLGSLVAGLEGEEGEMDIVAALSRASMMAGREQAALEHTERALVLAERAGNDELVVDLLVTRGTALFGLGRPREGRLLLEGALDISRQQGSLRTYLRAANNLTVSLLLDNPRAAVAVAQASVAQSERIPQQLAFRSQIWIAESHRFMGELAEANSIFDEIQLADSFPVEAHWRDSSRALIKVIRGETDMNADAVKTAEWLIATGDHQMVSAGHMTYAEYHGLMGEWESCYSHAMRAGIDVGVNDPGWGLWATVAALWMRDRVRLEHVMDRWSSIEVQGRIIEGYRLLAAAGMAALIGDTATASTTFVSLLNLWEPIAWTFDLAMVRALFAALVGLDDPAAFEAARLARDWIDRSGAVGLLEVWKAGLPMRQTVSP